MASLAISVVRVRLLRRSRKHQVLMLFVLAARLGHCEEERRSKMTRLRGRLRFYLLPPRTLVGKSLPGYSHCEARKMTKKAKAAFTEVVEKLTPAPLFEGKRGVG